MENNTNHNQNYNPISCYGTDYDENVAYEEINISEAELRAQEALSQGFANAAFPFK